MNNPNDTPNVEFKSGAKRSKVAVRYDLIPSAGLRRLAERYTMGAAKYGEGNWTKGLADPEYVAQFRCHMIAHMWKYLDDGCKLDDNLAAIAWGAFALMEVEDQRGAARKHTNRGTEGDRPVEQGAQAPPRDGPGAVWVDPRGGGGGDAERGFGLIASRLVGPSPPWITQPSANLRALVKSCIVPSRPPKGGDSSSRSRRTKLVTEPKSTGRKGRGKR